MFRVDLIFSFHMISDSFSWEEHEELCLNFYITSRSAVVCRFEVQILFTIILIPILLRLVFTFLVLVFPNIDHSPSVSSFCENFSLDLNSRARIIPNNDYFRKDNSGDDH